MRPYLRANNDDPPTTKPLDKTIQQVLDDGSTAFLQSKGIKVPLTVLNGHHSVGWSEFTSQAAAQDFAMYLKTEMAINMRWTGSISTTSTATGRRMTRRSLW